MATIAVIAGIAASLPIGALALIRSLADKDEKPSKVATDQQETGVIPTPAPPVTPSPAPPSPAAGTVPETVNGKWKVTQPPGPPKMSRVCTYRFNPIPCSFISNEIYNVDPFKDMEATGEVFVDKSTNQTYATLQKKLVSDVSTPYDHGPHASEILSFKRKSCVQDGVRADLSMPQMPVDVFQEARNKVLQEVCRVPYGVPQNMKPMSGEQAKLGLYAKDLVQMRKGMVPLKQSFAGDLQKAMKNDRDSGHIYRGNPITAETAPAVAVSDEEYRTRRNKPASVNLTAAPRNSNMETVVQMPQRDNFGRMQNTQPPRVDIEARGVQRPQRRIHRIKAKSKGKAVAPMTQCPQPMSMNNPSNVVTRARSNRNANVLPMNNPYAAKNQFGPSATTRTSMRAVRNTSIPSRAPARHAVDERQPSDLTKNVYVKHHDRFTRSDTPSRGEVPGVHTQAPRRHPTNFKQPRIVRPPLRPSAPSGIHTKTGRRFVRSRHASKPGPRVGTRRDARHLSGVHRAAKRRKIIKSRQAPPLQSRKDQAAATGIAARSKQRIVTHINSGHEVMRAPESRRLVENVRLRAKQRFVQLRSTRDPLPAAETKHQIDVLKTSMTQRAMLPRTDRTIDTENELRTNINDNRVVNSSKPKPFVKRPLADPSLSIEDYAQACRIMQLQESNAPSTAVVKGRRVAESKVSRISGQLDLENYVESGSVPSSNRLEMVQEI